MRIGAIIKARALALIEVDELNQGGRVRLSDCIEPIVRRYQFETYPTKPESFDLEKGVKFGSGKFGDVVIDNFVIYPAAMYIDSLSSTADSRVILLDIFQWAKTEFGLVYTDRMVRQWAYVSDLMF